MTTLTLARLTAGVASLLGGLVLAGSLFVPAEVDPGRTLTALAGLLVVAPWWLLGLAEPVARPRYRRGGAR